METNINDFVRITPSFIVRKEFADIVTRECQELQFGVYHLGTEVSELKKWEWNELVTMTPEDILDDK